MFANVGCAYVLWLFLGLFGAHRFYVGRPVSGLVWLFTLGLFGVGWLIDVFLIPEFVEEYNKRVFHQQMLETGSALLFDGEYGGQAGNFYPTQPAFAGAVAPYSQHQYYPQPVAAGTVAPQAPGQQQGKGGYESYY